MKRSFLLIVCILIMFCARAQDYRTAVNNDSLFSDAKRGYATLGYFPIWNTQASAGYIIIHRSNMSLKSWLNFNGYMYEGKVSTTDNNYSSHRIRRNTGSAGISLSHLINQQRTLDLSAEYIHDRLYYTHDSEPIFTPRTINRLYLNSKITGSGALKWYASFDYSLFANATKIADYIPWGNPPGKTYQNGLSLRTGIEMYSKSRSKWNIDFFTDLYFNTSHNDMLITFDNNEPKYDHDHISFIEPFISTSGNVSVNLAPSYSYSGRKFTLRVGALLQGTFIFPISQYFYDYDDEAERRFSIAPDILAEWIPSKRISLWIQANGGIIQNTFERQLAISQFTLPEFVKFNSRTVINSLAGVRIGLANGLSIEAKGGYAINKDWMVPYQWRMGYAFDFEPRNITGGYLEGALSYHLPGKIMAKVSFTRALSLNDEYGIGYWLWNGDCARQQLKADVTLFPTKKLRIHAGYILRDHRDLQGNISNLSADINYALNPKWNLFLSGDNLLNNRWFMVGNVEHRGISAMAGFSCKF